MKATPLLLILVMALFYQVQGQLLPFITYHEANSFLANPAIPATHQIVNPGTGQFQYKNVVAMTFRNQWRYFGQYGPKTYTATYQRYMKSTDYGIDFWIGGYFFNDQIGIAAQNGVFSTFTAHKDLGYDQHLYAGISLGLTQHSMNYDELRITQIGDPKLAEERSTPNETYLDPGIGLFYTSKTHYLGLSIPKVVGLTFDGDGTSNRVRLNHYYFLFGTTINRRLGPFRSIEPYVWLRVINKNADQMDINLKLEFDSKIPMWLTLGMDNYQGVHAHFGLISPIIGGSQDLKISFGYDTRTNLIRNFTGYQNNTISVGNNDFSLFAGGMEISVAWLMKR